MSLANNTIVSRKVNWVAAIDKGNEALLKELEAKMFEFYSNSQTYYQEINDYTYNIWDDPLMLPQKDIIKSLNDASRMLEIGCGKANSIRNDRELQKKYCGIDFSEELINANRTRYPDAEFKTIVNPQYFPYNDETFDVVFSHFVIEHSTHPHLFIDECIRLLKPGGILLMLCPDFLSKNRISSQRVGLTQGTGKNKLKAGRIWDAIVTGYDNKIRLPFICSKKRKLADSSPQFYINLNPTCFTDYYQADVDAVYLTYEKEMKEYSSGRVAWVDLNRDLQEYCKNNSQIYLKGRKLG